jgi:hypothetical protein
MNDPYDEDDGYEDDQYDYDDKYDPYKYHFKFDIDSNSSLSGWIQNMISDIFKSPIDDNFKINNVYGFPVFQVPVNSWNPITDKGHSLQFLGSNYDGDKIWKNKYFLEDKLHIQYINHLKSHCSHFIKQPSYYKGLFDILN